MTWPVVALGDVTITVRNGIFAKRPNDFPPGNKILRISSVRHGRVNLDDSRFVDGLQEGQVERFAVRPGDLLMTRYNGSRALVGTAGLVPPHTGTVIHPDKLIRIVLDPKVVDSKFANYQIQSDRVRAHLEPRIRTTAGQSGIAGTDVRTIPLVLPPLDEQRRIVERLEDHHSHLDAAEEYLAAAATRSVRWHRAATERLIWGSDAPRRPIRELLREPMRNGRSDRAAPDGSVGTRTLTLSAITRRSFSDENTKVTTTTAKRAEGLWLEPGDVFVQRSNTPALVGSSARYDGPRDWAIFPDLLIRLRSDSSVMDSRYLAAALRSEPGHAQMRERARGAAGSMPKIDQDTIGSALVPVPSLDLQRRVVAQVAEYNHALDRYSSASRASFARSAALRRSLLAAAFSGQLTAAADHGAPAGLHMAAHA